MLTLTFVLWRKMIWENKVNTERNRKNDRQINQLIHLCGLYSWTIWANTFLIQYKVTAQTCYLKPQESWLQESFSSTDLCSLLLFLLQLKLHALNSELQPDQTTLHSWELSKPQYMSLPSLPSCLLFVLGSQLRLPLGNLSCF